MNLLLIIMACLAGMAAGAAVAWLWWRGQWARRESAWQTSLAQQEERQRTAQERLSEQQAALAQAELVVVYAEQVHSAAEWATAVSLGVGGMTGPEASRRMAA